MQERNQGARGGNTKKLGQVMPLKGTPRKAPSLKENTYKEPTLHKDGRA